MLYYPTNNEYIIYCIFLSSKVLLTYRWTLPVCQLIVIIMSEQNQSLVYNASSGIIMSNQSLVLRGLTRNHSGNYKCIGVNSHGTGISNSVQLTVRFSPVCQQPIRNIRGAGRSQSLTLSCPIQSLPYPLKFRWVASADSFFIFHHFLSNPCTIRCNIFDVARL